MLLCTLVGNNSSYEWRFAMLSTLRDVPQELDPVTLHNMVLMNMEENPTQGFEKLQFLLQQVACPPGEWVGKGRRKSATALISP